MTTEKRSTAAQRNRAGTFGEPGRSARITTEFRDRGKMVYELDCDETRLSLTMSAAPEEGSSWEIAGTVQVGAAPRLLRAVGASRVEALRALGDAWGESGDTLGLRPLNWLAIRDALTAVRGV